MIEPITLARPYAKAAFEHARGAGELAQWQDALAQLAAVTRDHKVSVMLKSPNQTAQQRAENLATLVGDSLPASVVNLLMIMADNGRLSLLPEVATLFEQFKQAVESTVTAVTVLSTACLNCSNKVATSGSKLRRPLSAMIINKLTTLAGNESPTSVAKFSARC